MASLYTILNKALLSDLAVNDSIMKKYNLYNFWGFTIPDALTMHAKAVNKRKLLKLGFRFFSYFFPLLFPVIGLFQACLMYRTLMNVKKTKEVYNIEGAVNYGLSYRISDMIARVGGYKPDVWLTVPWVKLNEEMKGSYYSIFSDWKIVDLIKAFFIAYSAGLAWYFSSVPMTHLIKSMHSIQWLMTIINLKRISNGIDSYWYVNHYGRWTTIVDEIVDKRNNVWLMHGLLDDTYDPWLRQKNVRKVFTFGVRFNAIIADKILEKDLKVDYCVMNTAIELNVLDNTQTKSILFIGQPQSLEIDKELMEVLVDDKSLNIFVKPHPLNDQNTYDTLTGIEIIKDKSYFPRVQLAISHSSTLGLEYEASGVNVIWTEGKTGKDIYEEIKRNLQY
jgi:hypothetical protein